MLHFAEPFPAKQSRNTQKHSQSNGLHFKNDNKRQVTYEISHSHDLIVVKKVLIILEQTSAKAYEGKEQKIQQRPQKLKRYTFQQARRPEILQIFSDFSLRFLHAALEKLHAVAAAFLKVVVRVLSLAYPAPLKLALDAGHVVAAFVFLRPKLAVRAPFYDLIFLPVFEFFVY